MGSSALYFRLCGHVLSALILKSKAGKLVDSDSRHRQLKWRELVSSKLLLLLNSFIKNRRSYSSQIGIPIFSILKLVAFGIQFTETYLKNFRSKNLVNSFFFLM